MQISMALHSRLAIHGYGRVSERIATALQFHRGGLVAQDVWSKQTEALGDAKQNWGASWVASGAPDGREVGGGQAVEP